VHSSLRIDEAKVVRAVAWRPEEPASVDFAGSLDGAEVRLQAEAYPFRADRRVKGKLVVSGLALERYAKLLGPDVAELGGEVDLDLAVQGSLGERPAASQEGSIRLRKVRAAFGGTRVAYEDTTWTGKASVQVTEPGSGLLVESDGTVEAAKSSVEQAGILKLGHDGLAWSGLLAYTLGDAGSELTGDGKLDLTGLGLELEGQRLHNGKLSWSGKTRLVLTDGTASDLTAEGAMRLQGTDVTSVDQQLRQESLDWKGKLSLAMPAGSRGMAVDWRGALEGKGFHAKLPAQELNAASTKLALDGSVAYARRGDTDDIASDGALSLEGVKVSLPGQTLEEERLEWKGKVKTVLPKAGEPVLQVRGRLAAGAMTAGLEEARLRLTHAGLVWEGAYDSTPAAAGATAPTSTLTVESPGVVAMTRPLLLAGADRLQAQGIRARGAEELTVAQLVVDKLHLVQPEDDATEAPALVSVAVASITDLRLRQPPTLAEASEVDVEAVRLESLVADLHRAAGGEFPLLVDLDRALGGVPVEGEVKAPPQPAGEAQEQASVAGRPAAAIRVADIEVTGESQVRFRDDTTKPPFVAVTDLSDARVLNLDSTRPDQESPFVVAGTIDQYARLSVKGEAKPFADRLTLDAAGELRNVRMPLLSPYTVPTLGYSFTSGKMDAEMKFKADQGRLNGQNHLVLQKLEVKKAEGVKTPELKLDMPLETALTLVRGKGGTIRLSVPVSGDVSDPHFSVQDAINTALAKATRKAVLTYLAFALQPYGSILLAADLATDVASRSSIILESVKFAPGSAELDSEALAYLEKLNGIMDDRPGLKIKVCGEAVEVDRLALRQKAQTVLQAERKAAAEAPEKARQADAVAETVAPVTDAELQVLARKRAQAVEAELLAKHGIEPERVFMCEPTVRKETEMTPQVEIRI
jgi:outer membrane protein OmpA-like peptidoglycan-associated protein